jgi:hypothetical protein
MIFSMYTVYYDTKLKRAGQMRFHIKERAYKKKNLKTIHFSKFFLFNGRLLKAFPRLDTIRSIMKRQFKTFNYSF